MRILGIDYPSIREDSTTGINVTRLLQCVQPDLRACIHEDLVRRGLSFVMSYWTQPFVRNWSGEGYYTVDDGRRGTLTPVGMDGEPDRPTLWGDLLDSMAFPNAAPRPTPAPTSILASTRAFTAELIAEVVNDTSLAYKGTSGVKPSQQAVKSLIRTTLNKLTVPCYVEPDDSVLVGEGLMWNTELYLELSFRNLYRAIQVCYTVTFEVCTDGRYRRLDLVNLLDTRAKFRVFTAKAIPTDILGEGRVHIDAAMAEGSVIGRLPGLYKQVHGGLQTGRKVNFAVTGGRP